MVVDVNGLVVGVGGVIVVIDFVDVNVVDCGWFGSHHGQELFLAVPKSGVNQVGGTGGRRHLVDSACLPSPLKVPNPL